MKSIEQYFHAVLLNVMYKVVLTVKSAADETSVCDDFNESYWALLPCAYCVIQDGWPTYFNAPVVAERGCRSARLVLSRLNSSPWVVSTLSLESLIVTSLGERILLRSLINVAAEVGVARRMGVKSLKQKKRQSIRKALVSCFLLFPTSSSSWRKRSKSGFHHTRLFAYRKN